MSIFNFPTPEPPEGAPAKKPVTVNELRHLFFLVDTVLRNTARRQTYTAEQVQDLLLDVRNLLDRLSSPAVLVELAEGLYAEAKELAAEVKGES